MERRVRALETRSTPIVSPYLRSMAERLAERDGHVYTVDELLRGAHEIAQSIGEPYDAARAVAWVAEQDGIPEAELWQALEECAHEN